MRRLKEYSLSVRKVSPNDQRDFLLIEFLESNLERIGLAFKINQNRGIHTMTTPLVHRTANLKDNTFHKPNLKSPSTQNTSSLILGHIWCSRALIIGYLLLSRLLHHTSTAASIWVTGYDGSLAIHCILVYVFGGGSGFIAFHVDIFGL
jgi:hypothetical protein